MKTIVSCWALAVLAIVVCADRAPAQEKATPKEILTTRDVLRLLRQPIDLDQKKYQEPQTLKEFLENVHQELPKGKRPRIVVDTDSFKEATPDAPDIYDTQIRFPALGTVTLGEALRIAIAKIPTNDAAMLVRRGRIEIGTQDRFAPARLLREPILGFFENQPFQEILDELTDQTGATFVIDPNAKDSMKTPVTATLRGNDTLESAIKTLAAHANLDVDFDDEVPVIRTRKKDDRDKTGFRFKNRRVDLALKEVSEGTGKTIVIDPRVLDDMRLATEFFRNGGGRGLNFMGVGFDGMIGMLGAGPPPPMGIQEPIRYQYAVTGTFRKGTSVENMVRMLASMVELSVVVMDDAIFVSDDEGIRRMEAQLERKRFDRRRPKSK